MKTAIAIAAHPDDIEFMMAGTLLLLKKQGTKFIISIFLPATWVLLNLVLKL